MDADQALALAAGLCRVFEGFSSVPYTCAAGRATIGYGATHYLDGRIVTLRDAPISKVTAEVMLCALLREEFLPPVLALCPGLRTPEQTAAILDFTYNLGAGALRASTLRKRINAGRFEDVPAELMKWNKGGGRVLPGLTRRRKAEAELFSRT